jgi:flagellar FliJ protein
MFNFRLQRLLELREQAEQARARALASAQDTAETARRERDSLATVHGSARAEIDAAQRSAPRIGHLQQLGFVLQSLDQRLETAGETVRSADQDVTDAQRVLDAAARDRRVLDRLKGRHAEQWRAEAAHQDRLGMDEIALTRFARRADTRASEDASTRTRVDADAPDTNRTNGSHS